MSCTQGIYTGCPKTNHPFLSILSPKYDMQPKGLELFGHPIFQMD